MKRSKELPLACFLCLTALVGSARADTFCILEEEQAALQARIDLIERAEHTLDLAYYAVDTDEVPIALLELLRQASLRGVEVRLLVDGFKSRLPSKFESYLMRHGVEIRIYHQPHQCNPRWLNRRLHSKLMIVDQQVAIIGSRNLENEFFQYDPCDDNFVDCEAIVTGEVVDDALQYFNWLWCTPDVSSGGQRDSLSMDVLNYRPYGQTPWKKRWRRAETESDYQRLLNESLQRVACRYQVEFPSTSDWTANSVDGLQVRLLHDCCTDKKRRCVQKTVIALMDSAEHCLLIESPYPAFHRDVRDAISRARCRGVKVTIFTNSLQSTDQGNVYAAYQNHKRGLLAEGVRLREYCGDNILHAKTMIVDHHTMMLGSYNFDARSDLSNLELCIIIHDPRATAILQSSVARRMSRSTRIDQGLLLDVGDDATVKKRSALILRRTYVEMMRGFL